jgi:hypothetical protein
MKMDFEEWWKKTNAGKPYTPKIMILAKSFAREAWLASRENQQEYGRHAFCRSIDNGKNCLDWVDGDCCFVLNQDCTRTAKEFRRWLKENGYRIVKD